MADENNAAENQNTPQPAAPSAQPAPQQPAATPASQPAQTSQKPPQKTAQPEAKPAPAASKTAPTQPNAKKILWGCAGLVGAAILFFIIFALIFVAQTSATGENPLARALGMSTASFINTIILLVNLIFISLTLVVFLLGVVGAFTYFMARKDDKPTKKRGLTQAGISALVFFFVIMIWAGLFLFMDSKRVPESERPVSAIVTEPQETLGLTAPVSIRFDSSNIPVNTNQFDILSYAWDFGDGDTSTVASPSHEFTGVGRYDVQLRVTVRNKQTGEETTTSFTHTVVVANAELNASFTMTPASGPAPLNVKFDASESTAPAGEITSYDWDFNNDNNFTDASGITVEREFPQAGGYSVNLRVTDNTGQYKVVTQELTVSGPNQPTAVIDIPSGNGGKYFTDQQYTFQAGDSSSPNGSIEKYQWNFGDNSATANTRTASHTYSAPGTYEVRLSVTDEDGKTGSASKTIKVEKSESMPVAVLETVPPPAKEADKFIAGTVPFEVVFDASASQDPDDNIVDYQWDFNGDGQTDESGEKVTHTFTQEGAFIVTLTVVDAENNESQKSITVQAGARPLQARVTATPVEGEVPLTVQFDATASAYPGGQIVSYEWDFGDGTPKRIDAAQVTYKYTQIGTFNVSVTAIASDSARSTAVTSVSVRPVPLTACFTAVPDGGEAPLEVAFDPGCSTGGVTRFSWNFGDGQVSRTRRPSHTFNAPGNYQVTLEVSDNDNVVDTYTKNILVTGNL